MQASMLKSIVEQKHIRMQLPTELAAYSVSIRADSDIRNAGSQQYLRFIPGNVDGRL